MGSMDPNGPCEPEFSLTPVTGFEPGEPLFALAGTATAEKVRERTIEIPQGFLGSTFGRFVHPRDPTLFFWDQLELVEIPMKGDGPG